MTWSCPYFNNYVKFVNKWQSIVVFLVFVFFSLLFIAPLIFHFYGDITITGEGLQILTCIRLVAILYRTQITGFELNETFR